MVARWTIQFSTVTDQDGLIIIYDADYTGEDTIALTPASNPISISMQKQDMLTPVMSDSGYLRIVDDGNPQSCIDDIHPEGAMSRPVELYMSGALTWRGFVSPEAYSTDYAAPPVIVEFPLVGVLEALSCVNITDTGTGLQLIGDFLKQCMLITGFSWDGLIFPRQLLSFDDFTNAGELRLELSRYNFLHLNDLEYINDEDWTEFVGDSYLKVLEDICRYFGWTASQQGKYLLLSTPRTDIEDYAVVDLDNLEALILNPNADITVQPITRSIITSLTADGIAHRRSRENGYKKIILITTLNQGQSIYPEILYQGPIEAEYSRVHTEHYDTHTFDYDLSITGICQVLNINKEHIQLGRYEVDENDNVVTLDYEYPTADDPDSWAYIGGNIVKCVTYNNNEEPSRLAYIKALRLFCDWDGKHFTQNYPLAKITSRGVGCFPSGGALAITANLQNSYFWNDDSSGTLQMWLKENYGMTQWGPFMNNLRLSLKIGSYYYNGTTWTTQHAIFAVKAGSYKGSSSLSNNSVGTISNSMTLEQPYKDSALGFIVPIDRNLQGKMEITLYPWTINHGTYGEPDKTYSSLYLSNLKISYFNDEDSDEESTSGVRLAALTGSNYQRELTVNLNLTSDLKNNTGLALLWFNGTAVGKIALTYPSEQTLYQPERWALQTMLMLFSKSSDKLTLETELSSTLQLYDLVQIYGKNYIIMGKDVDYADEHMTLTVINYG